MLPSAPGRRIWEWLQRRAVTAAREVEKQMREQLRPETRSCPMCVEADECLDGMCSFHEEKFRALCMAVSCGSVAKPTPAPLGRMLPLQS